MSWSLYREHSSLFQICHIPSGIHSRRAGRGTQPVSLPRTGTSGLLAVLHHSLRLAGSYNLGGRTGLLRRKIPYPLREHSSTCDIKSRAGSRKPSPENLLGLSKVEVSVKR